MGFLEAVKSLGEMDKKRHGGGDGLLDDIVDFLELPLDPRGTPPEKIIRVWCHATNIEECLANETVPLTIKGINKIDCTDYGAGSDTPDSFKIKRELLYKKPAGSNVTWSYSPLYKLGRGKATLTGSKTELIGKDADWAGDSNSRLFKLNKNVIKAFSEAKTWAPDSAALVMEALARDFLDALADLWTEAKGSTIMVFGVTSPRGEFLWPGEITQYIGYFRSKLQPAASGSGSAAKKKDEASYHCASCMSEIIGSDGVSNASDIFPFATFDKPGFLPGARSGQEGKAAGRKVWPLCSSCAGLLTRGRGYINLNYLQGGIIIPGLNVYAIPELLMSEDYLAKADKGAANFLKQGIRTEERLFSYLARQGEYLVFHFVFWEKNQSQELVHLMIEDVPPTRLKQLEEIWGEAIKTYPFKSTKEIVENFASLDYALKSIYRFFLYGARNDGEEKWLRNRALGGWGRLLQGLGVNVEEVKNLAVSRLPSCFADEKWLKFMGPNMMQSARIIDFLARINER